MTSPKLLGISHLLVSTESLHPYEASLARVGYERHISQPRYPNPAAKAPFLVGLLSEFFEMSFLRASGAGTKVFPAVELLRESHDAVPGATPLHAELSWPDPLADAPACAGLTVARSDAGPEATVRVACRDLRAGFDFWCWLGADGEWGEDGHALVRLRNRLLGPSLCLRLEAAADQPLASLDQRGLVALAFVCRDAAALRAAMAAETGAHVGECFEMAPLGKPLKLFFARSPSGEIYEFLSPVSR